MIRFYAPEIKTLLQLPEVESAHCCRVLRMKTGDRISVVDGAGYSYECEIVDANPRHTSVEIISKQEEPSHWKPSITLAVAPTKNMDRMEWLAEKAVEIGVDRIVFLDCERSVRKVVKRERIEKIMVSAMKQSLKAKLPQLEELVRFRDFISRPASGVRYMGYCDEKTERIDFSRAYEGVQDVTILIGPEGDFSETEVAMAFYAGFLPVTFGATRLRTETAALYALCAAHTIITQHSNPL